MRNVLTSKLPKKKEEEEEKYHLDYIGEDGYVYKHNGEKYYKTGIFLQGPKGLPGVKGKDGLIPRIGNNGNWFIGDTDTFVKAALDTSLYATKKDLDDLIDNAPEVLNTLKELANAIGDDADFATNINNRLTDIENVAYQIPVGGIPESDLSQGVKDKMNEKEVSNNKVSSWQATPDNTHYPSEKLVKDSLDAKAGIGDVLFANFSNLTPKKTFEYDVSDTAYHPLFSRANTGISQLMSEVDDIVKFRITVTGTNIYARVDVVVRFQPAPSAAAIMAWNNTYNINVASTGIYYLRDVFPRAANSGYNWIMEFNCYNNTSRHIKIEVFEDTDNISWTEEKIDSSYNSTYQVTNLLLIRERRGLCANLNWYLIESQAGTANSSAYVTGFLNTWIGGTMPLAGEALKTNELAIMSGQKVYKATNENIAIDCDCGVFILGGDSTANTAVSYINIRQKFSWTALTADPALTMDTFDRGDQVYLRCTLGQDGKIYPDGHLSNVKSAGYTWVHIGTAASATAINLDTCGKPFITLNNDGKVTHINGTAVMDSSMSKWGVVSQTQTWTQASDGGYDYTMSNLQYGWIPQANIDLYEAAGAVFNEQSGYFEIGDLADISYQEMLKIYYTTSGTASVNMQACSFPNRKKVRTTLPITNSGTTMALSYNFTNTDFEQIALVSPVILSSLNSALNGSYYLKKINKRVTLNQATAITITSSKSLEDVQFYGIKSSISIADAPRLSVESILYMINNEASTSAITITLHPTAYARAIADSDVQAALQAHTNVSLASAT